ncbi:hypothetical protein JY97_03135 [Alkalispirochaeta odontotermitis]|nr:hypothetical protein JY97_03135 [Alkalispirochaeta odontotermitis]
MILLVLAGSGILTIYLIIDFFEYLKKYHVFVWRELCFERPFGRSQEDFFFYPINPSKFFPFLVSTEDSSSGDIGGYKKNIKISFLVFVGTLVFHLIARNFI